MNELFRFPESFPNDRESVFLDLLLRENAVFAEKYARWREETDLDLIDYATLRLLPFLYLRLSRAGIKGPEFGRIQGVYKLAWVSNQRLFSALKDVAALCELDDIRMIVLKGVPLLSLAYGNAAARFLGDVDILISEHDMKRLMSRLEAAGWRNVTVNFPVVRRLSERSIARITKEATYRRESDGLEADIHWRLFDVTGTERDGSDTPFEELWKRSVPCPIGSRIYRSLSAEDMLLHVLAHGAEDNAHRPFRWVLDAVMLIRSCGVDWDKFVSISRTSSFAVHAAVALRFLESRGFVRVPEAIRRFASDHTAPSSALEKYHARAERRHDPFGFFRILWNSYWRYESRGGNLPGVRGLSGFLTYLAWARGFEHRTDLPRFLFDRSRTAISATVRLVLHRKSVSKN